MGRTKVYRLLDKLKEKQLVEFKFDQRGMKFGASSPQKFQQLLIDKEQQLASLQKSLPGLLEQLSLLQQRAASDSKVLYYEGIEGLKQVNYNITKTKDILRVFEVEHMESFLPVEFSENIRRKIVENKIQTRDLTNKKSFPGFTDVKGLISDLSQFRYLDPQKLRISFEALIYNDVYATYSYKSNKIFCIEIHNQELAAMQKQLFDFIWEEAEIMEFIDERGGARVRG
jgi:sugar-specific transcriptional regulator TrmB